MGDLVSQITKVVSDEKSCSVDDLQPLGNILDVECVETLVESSAHVRITFQYESKVVTVFDDGSVAVT